MSDLSPATKKMRLEDNQEMLKQLALPDHSYQLGDSVVRNVCIFKGRILVHVRKCNWYTNHWHPTNLGIAMNQATFDSFVAYSYKVSYGLDHANAKSHVIFSSGIKAEVNPEEQTVMLMKETTYNGVYVPRGVCMYNTVPRRPST